jgi:hypothetical protein
MVPFALTPVQNCAEVWRLAHCAEKNPEESKQMVPLALTTVPNCVEVCKIEWALRLAHCAEQCRRISGNGFHRFYPCEELC